MNFQNSGPTAVEHSPSAAAEAAKGSSLLRLWRQLSPRRRWQFFVVLGLMLAGALAEVVTLGAVLPFLAVIADPGRVTGIPLVEDTLAALGLTRPGDLPLVLTLIFAGAATVAAAVRVLLAWASNKYVFMLGHDLGMAVYERVLYRPYAWHVSKNTSEIIAAINKVQMITGNVLLPLMQAASAVLIGAFIVAALIFVDPIVSLAAFTGFGLIYLFVSLLTRTTLRANSRVIARAQASRIQSVQEGLGGIRDVILDGSQPVFLKRFRRLDTGFRNAQATSNFIGAAPRFVIEGAGMVLIAVLAYVLSHGEGGFVAVLPVLGALALGAQRLLPLMQLVYNGWTRIASNAHVLTDVVDLLEQPTPTPALPAPPMSFERDIVFRNVSFAYGPDQAPVLRNVELSIPKGSHVGIVGKTGSGKSTLVDLLMGLLDSSDGEILIDGRPLDSTTRRAWQSQIGHVPQTIYLTDGTISENIAFGHDPRLIDPDRVREAAHQAQIADFIDKLPHGYETVVGERGVRLSGGQRQRIGIARALYRRAKVLILDEATSALDGETESTVMGAISALSENLTVLIIAHRLSTIKAADKIINLDSH